MNAEPLTDLPVRLRAFAEHHDSTIRIRPWTLAREAADEIERLRAELASAHAAMEEMLADTRKTHDLVQKVTRRIREAADWYGGRAQADAEDVLRQMAEELEK